MCLAYFPRYYWNNDMQRCVLGIYGGCKATANNFMDQDSCEKAARRFCLEK